jgi:hypothetical protein
MARFRKSNEKKRASKEIQAAVKAIARTWKNVSQRDSIWIPCNREDLFLTGA